ncbi:MAG: hypothetical protein QM537_09690 [Candidatus Symbiobacter sp.]|nr:hypothetical protein [Candidatus Symbiobacter sp.]
MTVASARSPQIHRDLHAICLIAIVRQLALVLLQDGPAGRAVTLNQIVHFWTKFRQCPGQANTLLQILRGRMGVESDQKLSLSEPAYLFGCVQGILSFEYGFSVFPLDVVGEGVKRAHQTWQESRDAARMARIARHKLAKLSAETANFPACAHPPSCAHPPLMQDAKTVMAAKIFAAKSLNPMALATGENS